MLGWLKSPFSSFCKIKDIFSFSPITLLIWIFWVCWLSPTWYNVDCSQLISWFDLYELSTALPNRGASSSEKTPAWSFANHFWHVWSVTAPSPYAVQFFFAFQLHFYLSWNNKAQYAKNVAYFLPSLISKWPKKIHQFWYALKKKARWYDSCHSIIWQNCFEWSSRQLSTIRAVLQKKPNELFGQPNTTS